MDHTLGFYVFGISRARRMGIDRVLIHTKIFDILAPPSAHADKVIAGMSLNVNCGVFSG